LNFSTHRTPSERTVTFRQLG